MRTGSAEREDRMEQFDEIPIPMMEEKPKKNKNWKIIAGIAAGCVVVLAAAIVFVIKVSNLENTLVKGVHNLTKEMNERRQLWEEATGNTLMNELNRVKTTVSFNISGDELPVTIGFDSTVLRDGTARKIWGETALSVMNTELLGMELYGEAKKAVFSVPKFLDQNLEFDVEGIDTQYNNSLFAEKFGPIEAEGISFDLFPEESHFMWTELFLEWQKAAEEKDSTQDLPEIIIEELEEKAQVVLSKEDDKEYLCTQYRIVVPQERLEKTAGDSITAAEGTEVPAGLESEIKIMQDVSLLVSIDENDRIVQVSLEEPLVLSARSQEYEFPIEYEGSVSFAGESRAIDEILVDMRTNVQLNAVKAGSKALIPFRSDVFEDGETMEVHMGMEIVYDEDDTSVICSMDELAVEVNDLRFKVNGKITAEPLREEIKPLNGETIRIFEITEAEYEDLEEQLQRKLLYWLMALGSMEEW